MKTIDRTIQLVDKPYEEMSLEELYREQMVHKWHRTQMRYHIERLKKKKWWLENNKPILTVEEIKQKYENGEMTEGQYKVAFAARKRAIISRMRLADYMNFAFLIAENEDAVATYLEELTEQAKLEEKTLESRKKPRRRGYDPRKPISPHNRLPWQERVKPRKMPRLNSKRRRWHQYKAQDYREMRYAMSITPVSTWDADKLKKVAEDRGYFTEAATIVVLSETLDLTAVSARMLLNNGKFTWSQCLAIGAVFEMTPKEFCDVFLNGYFNEVTDGVYKAHIDDIPAFVANAKLKRAGRKEEDENKDEDGEDIE